MQYPVIAQPQYAFAPTMMAEGGLVPAARAVQSQGRNGDSMLVHMTPGEVGGLQALAMQHGGSLTTNPQTGLPEAGFLKNLLPTVLGLGASFLFPAASPYLIGAGVGGVEAIRTGDLGKGLLAGLGAFGGANIGASLGAAGTAGTAAAGAGGASAAGAGGATTGLEAFADPNFIAETGAGAAMSGAPATVGAGGVPFVPSSVAAQGVGASGAGLSSAEMAALKSGSGYGAPLSAGETFRQSATQAGRGLSNLGTSEGWTALSNASGGNMALARDVAMAGAPALMAGPEYAPPSRTEEESNYEGPYTPSERRVSYPGLDERRRTSEYTYFTPSNPVPFDEGGKVEEDRSIKMPDASYVAGQMPEFSHGFKAIEIEGMPVGGSPGYQLLNKFASDMPDTIGGKGSGVMKVLMKKAAGQMGDAEREKYAKMEGYEYDPRSQRLVKGSSSGGLPALAKGGSVPMLEDGGFVLTKKAVDGLGKGSNKKGQKVASRGLGAIPIKGPGTGTSDSIKTSIEGKRPALVSNGEAYVPKKQVAKHGGAKKFYALMKKAEKRA